MAEPLLQSAAYIDIELPGDFTRQAAKEKKIKMTCKLSTFDISKAEASNFERMTAY